MRAGGTADTAREILTSFTTWAVVGASPESHKPASFVPAFLQSRGYRVIPVNPTYAGQRIFGETCYPDLTSIPASDGVEVVDLFRRSHLVLPHVDEACEIGAKAIWMQAGIVNDDAAAVARAAGMLVVMDRCPKVDIPTLLGNSFRAGHAAA
ncbi:MAG TPA: CoA-binding protein [Acidimicrobiales bacterium]